MQNSKIIYESPKDESTKKRYSPFKAKNKTLTGLPAQRTDSFNHQSSVLSGPASYSRINKPIKEKQLEKLSNYNRALNPSIHKLAETYSRELIITRRGFTPIHVDEIASRLARLYETVRKVVDWKDDNALRRGAIERILKRILFPKLTGFTARDISTEELAETTTIELIRGGHLPNDTIPRERIAIVSKAMGKYMYFLEYMSSYKAFEVKQKINYTTFILETASCEIEEILTHPVKEYGLIETMATILEKRILVSPKDSLIPEEKHKQIFIATCRALYDLDDNFIIYQLLKQKYPNWHKPSPELTAKIAKELPGTRKNIQEEIDEPVIRKFTSIAERADTVFMLLDDVLERLKEKPEEIKTILGDKKKFTKLITRAYKKRYETLKTRLFRLAIFSTLSVFLSNCFTFYLVEVPLARLFYEGFNLVAAIVDFLVPTAVMFFLVAIIRPPQKDNIKKVIPATLGFVYKDEKRKHYQIRIKDSKSSISRLVMLTLYVYTILLAFAGIAYVFYVANLPMTSVILDTFTIALTVFAAVTIKNKSEELNVDEHTSVQDFLLDIVSVPIAKVGSILAKKWKEYNVVAILFNYIIETPLAMILNFVQDWSEFIKERRAELR